MNDDRRLPALNLLPPERRMDLYRRIIYGAIERLMILSIIVTLTASLLAFGVRIRLSKNLSDILPRLVLSTEYIDVNNEIKKLNESISRIEEAQNQAVPATVLLDDLVGRIPPGILISSLEFEMKTMALRINGRAATRDQLLAYEALLLDSPYISELESPISNLLQKTDVTFRFEGLLDVERLRQELDPSGS